MKYVYLIESENGDYKIGRTRKDPKERVKQLQTSSSEKLNLIFQFETSNELLMERMLHMHFHNTRKMGEWFVLTDEQVLGFSKLCAKLEKTILSIKDNTYIKKRYNT